VTQEQGSGYGDVAVQGVGQFALNKQDAWASAESKQIEPENENLSVGTFGHGAGGEVSQGNSSTALAASLNSNDLTQTAAQGQGGDMGPRPISSKPERRDEAPALPGPDQDGDSVSQLNKSVAAAISLNSNRTTQTAAQSQDGKGDVAVQAAGQVAGNKQKAGSEAESFQLGASNQNGHVSGPDLCKHDFCKPDPCKDDPRTCKPYEPDPGKCEPDLDTRYGCKHDPCERKCEPSTSKPERCKRDFGKPKYCKPDFERRDHGKPWSDGCKSKRCDPCDDRKPCEHDRYSRPWPQEARQVMPDRS
jgi:hypothetical protein